MIWSIIVGGVIGWLAGKLMGSKGGVLRNIIRHRGQRRRQLAGGRHRSGGPQLTGLLPHRRGRRLRGDPDLPVDIQITG